MATDIRGGVVGLLTTMIAPGNWYWVQIHQTWIQFFLANLATFHVATILAIYTYIKPNI
jgi:hypothetical protein